MMTFRNHNIIQREEEDGNTMHKIPLHLLRTSLYLYYHRCNNEKTSNTLHYQGGIQKGEP